MSWYRRTKFAASPKNIVNQWKVDDPFLKFFIFTYEPIIDLSKIKSKEQLTDFIKTSLIPDLKNKIDRKNPNSYYKKHMSQEEIVAELNDHPDDPRLQDIKRIIQNSPEKAKQAEKTLLDVVNEDKKLSFEKWWKFMEQDYGSNPAFFYSVLSPMFEQSPSTVKNPPPPAHREAIASISNEIGTKGVNQMNIPKKFSKLSFILDKNTSESIDIDEQGNQIDTKGMNEKEKDKVSKKTWIRIDSKLRDSKKFNANEEKLMRFSTDSGWCIAQPRMTNTYLSKGDFWLYFENKSPKAAIRLQGDKKVEEIRGLYNKQDTLDPYWEPVTSFLHNTDFNYQNNSFYKHLKDIMLKNANLDDPKVFQNLLKAIESDPTQFRLISDKNKVKFPGQVQQLALSAARGYDKKMNDLLDAVEGIPTSGNEYQRRFGAFQNAFSDIPEEVKPYMSGNIQGRLVSVHKAAFMRNPLEFEFFPQDMKDAITDEEKEKAWTNYVGRDPYRYNDLRIPMEIRKLIPLRPIVEGWNALVDQNIDHADNIPKFILKYLPENYIENKIIIDFKKYPCNRTSQGYDKLQRIQERGLLSEDQISQVYADFVSKNASNKSMRNPLLFIPPQYRDSIKDKMEDFSPITDKYYAQVISNASYFKSIPDDSIRNTLLNNPQYSQGVIKAFERLQQKYGDNWNGFWVDLPEDVKIVMSPQIKDAVANFWLPYVQNNISYLDRLDNIIRPIVEDKLQNPPNIGASGNWFKRIRACELV